MLLFKLIVYVPAVDELPVTVKGIVATLYYL